MFATASRFLALNTTNPPASNPVASTPRCGCTDHPATLARVRREWSISKAEVADGFYPPVCAAVRVVFDHLAVGVFGSFSVTGIMYGILWHHFLHGACVRHVG